MEQQVTIVSSIGKDGVIVHMINDKTFRSDENGVTTLFMSDIVGAGDRGILEFDRKFSLILGSDDSKMIFYDTVLMNNRFGIGDMADILGVDRKIAKDIMTLGLKNKILIRFDTQYKLNPEKKDQVRSMIRQIMERTGQDDSPEPYKAGGDPALVVTVPLKRVKK